MPKNKKRYKINYLRYFLIAMFVFIVIFAPKIILIEPTGIEKRKKIVIFIIFTPFLVN